MIAPKTESDLIDLRDHFCGKTRASIVTGSGWTYVEEIKQLDRALADIAGLRNGLAQGAKVIEAGEKERRALLVRVASLTRALQLSHDCWRAIRQHGGAIRSAAENSLDEKERWEIEQAIAAEDLAGVMLLTAVQALRVRQLAAAAVSSEFGDQIGEILNAARIQ